MLCEVVGHADVSAGAGDFPLTLELGAIAGVKEYDVVVVVAYVNGTFNPAAGLGQWGGLAPKTLTDTLDGMAYNEQGANPNTAPFEGTQQFWFDEIWCYATAGSDTITFTMAQGSAGPAGFTSAYLSATVYRYNLGAPLFPPTTGLLPQSGSLGPQIAGNIANDGDSSLTPPLQDTVTIPPPPATTLPPVFWELVAEVSPGSGAPTSDEATFVTEGTGVMSHAEFDAPSGPAVTVEMESTDPTGVLTLRGLYLYPPAVFCPTTEPNGGGEIIFGGAVGDSITGYLPYYGVGPVSFAVVSGSLPPGLVLNAGTGEITGTLTTGGTFYQTYQVTDAFGNTGQQMCSLIITGGSPSINCPGT
jgi:hypothetical protein